MRLIDLHDVIATALALFDDDLAKPSWELQELVEVVVCNPTVPSAGPDGIHIMAQRSQRRDRV